jgi:CRISPR-associated protein Cmr4
MSSGNDLRQATALLFLHAQTSLHPGSGTALGVVDLPIQRERHTQWPLIPGTSLKGVLRDTCRRRSGSVEELFAAFGPDTLEADKHAGALSVTDARILAFPVRSLRGVFAWTTCISVLERFNRDAGLAQLPQVRLSARPAKERAICAANSPLLVDGNRLVLEEFEFERAAELDGLGEQLARRVFLVGDAATPDAFRQRLVVLHDDDFTHFVRHATEIVARIGLNAETKTVKQGALFYQEFLPTETILYAVVFAHASRRDGRATRAANMLEYLRGQLPEVLQIGGDETTGKGLCTVRLCDGKEGV